MSNGDIFLVRDLAGCQVVTVEGEVLGTLTDVFPTGSNDVFVVGKEPNELLIPALKDVVKEIDLVGRRIVVSLPPGLRAW
jgi:16S rRNA processing protein RimM